MKKTIKYGLFSGLALGIMFFAVFADYSLGFYYGSVLIEDEKNNSIFDRAYSVSDVIIVFFSILIGGMSMG